MKMKKYLVLLFVVIGCNSRESKVDKSKLLGFDYRLFQDTSAWDLAKAVEDNDLEKIIEISKTKKELLNLQESRFGSTLLMFAIHNHQFDTAKLLIDLGADVNIYDQYNGKSAIILACKDADTDPKIVNILLEHGANVNDIEKGKREEGNTTRDTPLINASRSGNLPLVTFLISKGANINYKNEFNITALREAVMQKKYSVILELLKNGVDINTSITYNEEQKKHYYLADELRFFMPELNSIEHKQKYEIIDFLSKKGIDYSKVPIPEYVIEKAKEKYPKDWQEYLKKY
jgi:uncharacterized protein